MCKFQFCFKIKGSFVNLIIKLTIQWSVKSVSKIGVPPQADGVWGDPSQAFVFVVSSQETELANTTRRTGSGIGKDNVCRESP